jgi:hypothetical protein
MKNPQLRNVYQKLSASPVQTPGGPVVVDGFGYSHNGQVASLLDFFQSKIFSAYTNTEKLDMAAYLLCFDTGTAPAVGYTRTLTAATVAAGASDWSTLEAQAVAANIDLVVRGTVSGQVHGLLYNPTANTYQLDTGGTLSHAQLQTLIVAGDVLSVMGVYPGTGTAAVGTIL